MKITNHLNLPQPIVDAVANDPYNSGDSDISVTRLIAPPRQVYLNKKHHEELVEDCSDRLFSLMGQAMHHILERGGDLEGHRIIERRLFVLIGGWKLSGQIDIWEDGTLDDYKFTSVWETMNGLSPEKIAQLNILKWLCERNGIYVKKLRIVAMYRDWSKTKSKTERDYPKHQIGVIESPMWSEQETLEYICDRIDLHKAAEIELPECTDEEMWARPTKYAVMKEGNIKAKRLLDSHADALEWAVTKKLTMKDHYIEERKGEKVRCENYCAAAAFCKQFNPDVSI
tara:strand:+ start:1173 stop:2027 length:855 start_codon:yes stop_codon:yes gene_type:complete